MEESHALSEPPEGAIVGESVPPGSEPDEFTREQIERAIGVLKSHGEPYISMSESRLEEKAKEKLRAAGADL